MNLSQIAALGTLTAVTCVLSGSVAAMQRPAPKPVKIHYQSSRCFGSCPAYAVTVGSNGLAQFEGHSATAVQGKRSFRVSTRDFNEFGWALEKYRFAKGGEPGSVACRPEHTDDITVSVTWTLRNGKTQVLNHYFGCDAPGFLAMEKALAAAPKLLPIKAFVGGRF
jgi:Domain of unknown function (DUF6438)